MISFLVNRHSNGLPLQNSLTFLATGVLERVFKYLHTLGLSSCRTTAVRAMEHLRVSREATLRSLMSRSYSIRPFLCIDNFDILQRINNTRIESASHLFHGTWGFLHFLPEHLRQELPHGTSSDDLLRTYKQALVDCQKTPIQLKLFRPTSKEMTHWRAVLKSQLARVMYKYVISGGDGPSGLMATRPPPIDPIPLHKSPLFLLGLMDAPDNSADGVSQILDDVASQCGLKVEDMLNHLQVVEGDLGTCQNIESLCKRRFPAGSAIGGLDNLLTIPGVSHIMWNVAQSLLTHHWGDTRNAKDTGAWKSWQSLGGSAGKLPASMDFNMVMRATHRIHTATLVSCLRYI